MQKGLERRGRDQDSGGLRVGGLEAPGLPREEGWGGRGAEVRVLETSGELGRGCIWAGPLGLEEVPGGRDAQVAH